jgi:hypothetical protein
MVVTGVADRMPKRIRALVYADGFIPENGQSLFSILGPERTDKMRAGAREWGDGWRVKPLPASYYRVADPEDAAYTDRMSTGHPIRCFEQPLKLSGAGAKLNRVISAPSDISTGRSARSPKRRATSRAGPITSCLAATTS